MNKVKRWKKRQRREGNSRPSRLWCLVVIISTLFILIGSKYAMKDVSIFSEESSTVKGKVVEILNQEVSDQTMEDGTSCQDETVTFRCELLSGPQKGTQITAVQNKDPTFGDQSNIKTVEAGDLVVVGEFEHEGTVGQEWVLIDFYRFHIIVGLGLVFAALMILIGRIKGINALISLSFTAIFVFTVFLPWVLGGKNVYVGVTITAVFTIVMSLLLIEGGSKKSFVTIVSCCIGTAVAALLPIILNQFLHLSGMVDEHSVYLTMLNPEHPIDLVAIIFAGVIIGALGAAMDVAMDISSSMYEIIGHVPDISFRDLFKSGMSIGRDIMGTMANTLVLAYIGSSMGSVLLLVTYSESVIDLLNKEMVIAELLQALSGSIALLLTVPFTVLIADVTYTRMMQAKRREQRSEERRKRIQQIKQS